MRTPWLVGVAMMLPLLADDRGKHLISAEQTARFSVATAGTIRLENSFGEVDVDGWDRPEVEVSVVRSSEHYYGDRDRTAAQQRLDQVHVTTKQEGNDVVISTQYPPSNPFLHPLSRRSDVEIHYRVHAPRASKLSIDHNNGGVNVSGVSGDIHAKVVNGQITVTLAPDAHDVIDARCAIGDVYSDFDGKDRSRYVFGAEFQRPSASPAANLYLRVRLGDIVIVKQTGPPAE